MRETITMIKLKLATDIVLAMACLTVSALGIVLHDVSLVAFGGITTVMFICFVWYDIIKLDNILPKYVITIGNGDYYNGKYRFTCFAKAKVYKTGHSIKRAIIQITVNMHIPATKTLMIEQITDENKPM